MNWNILSNLLLEDDDNVGNSEEVLMQTSGLYAYIPMKHYKDLVNTNGILTLNNYLSASPTRRELKNQFSHFGSKCASANNPYNSKSIRIFFNRIPEDMSECCQQIKENYIPVKISSKKLLDAKEKFKIFGINFPGKTKEEWIVLSGDDISKLNDLKEKWNRYFKDSCNLFEIYNTVPHGAIFSESGMIPKFAFKNIHN